MRTGRPVPWVASAIRNRSHLYIRPCGLRPRGTLPEGLKMPSGSVNSSLMDNGSIFHDVAVVGGGPAGLSAAIALAQTGIKTVLIARRAPYADNRTTALLGGSIAFLDSLGVWAPCREQAAPLSVMRLVDDTGRLFRAPEVRFSAD